MYVEASTPIVTKDGTSKEVIKVKGDLKTGSVGHSVVYASLRPCDPEPTRFLCPWNSPGKNTGVAVTILFFRGSFQLRDQTRVSCIAGRGFTIWVTREAPIRVELWSDSTSVLVRRVSRELLSPPSCSLSLSEHAPRRDQENTKQKVAVWNHRGGLAPRINQLEPWSWTSSHHSCDKINLCCLIRYPVYNTLLWHPEQTNIRYNKIELLILQRKYKVYFLFGLLKLSENQHPHGHSSELDNYIYSQVHI